MIINQKEMFAKSIHQTITDAKTKIDSLKDEITKRRKVTQQQRAILNQKLNSAPGSFVGSMPQDNIRNDLNPNVKSFSFHEHTVPGKVSPALVQNQSSKQSKEAEMQEEIKRMKEAMDTRVSINTQQMTQGRISDPLNQSGNQVISSPTRRSRNTTNVEVDDFLNQLL